MDQTRNILYFVVIAALIIVTGMVQSWNSALLILNMGLISAVMALGVNLQWGFAGLFNVGIMGFVALGGLAAVLVSTDPVSEAWNAGGLRILFALAIGAGIIGATIIAYRRITATRPRVIAIVTILGLGFFVYRALLDPAVQAVEAVNPALQGNLGGLGLPIILAWPVGGLFAAGAAWIIGKAALGLRSDYLAIATLGISEIIIAILKNEDWLARGVKNVIGLDRPVPKEIDLQESAQFIERASGLGLDPVTASALFVKINYALLFSFVLIILLVMAQLSLKSPWGRMMRAIRDNETAAAAMGKNVTNRHLQIFILGSAICGIAGAMMTTLDGQLTPGSYQPLRFTFLIWVMVIVGGSGNNFGAVLGGFLIWFLWVQVEPMSQYLVTLLTAGMVEDNAVRLHMMESVAYMRLLTMGLVLLLVLRFSPRGLIPEK
ncbi:MAG: branched-chain amino acid ABC transporter permease [Paracoccaceae bacterium]|jgi:branched-chain amino acid transport system permease protein